MRRRLPPLTIIRRISSVLLTLAMLAPRAPADQQTQPAPATSEHIGELIQQLGSTEYSQRQKARDRLMSFGVEAFDGLQQAQFDRDAEIRKQAEYLIRGIHVAWTRDDDPESVQRVLKNYRVKDFERRNLRIRFLSRIPDDAALTALCRLARFETSEELSKRAALTILQNAPAESLLTTTRRKERIRAELATSRRAAAQWLRAYADADASSPPSLETWDPFLAAEEAGIRDHGNPVRQEIVRDLMRWQIEVFLAAKQPKSATAIMHRWLAIQPDTREDLTETCDWLFDHEAWQLAELLIQRFEKSFAEKPQLLYRHAYLLQHNQRLAEAQEKVARAQRFPATDDDWSLHIELGVELQDRGWTDWAEQEYRISMPPTDPPTHAPVEATARLGWMLHDLGRDREAYDVLKSLVAWMEKDKTVVRLIQELDRMPLQVRGQMHYSHALALAKENKFKEQREALEQALRYDGTNADIVIAMYRLPGMEESFRQKTMQHLQRLTQMYQTQISLAQRDLQSLPGDTGSLYLAMQLNQYAWLIANTEGDKRAALTSSQRSIELVQDAILEGGRRAWDSKLTESGYRDTLARCHFALGEIQEAVNQQRLAVALEPHSGQIRRQLEFFETQLPQAKPKAP